METVSAFPFNFNSATTIRHQVPAVTHDYDASTNKRSTRMPRKRISVSLFNQRPQIQLNQFDFSSQKGWDDFYQQLENDNTNDPITATSTSSMNSRASTMTGTGTIQQKSKVSNSGDNVQVPDSGIFEFEWHSSIPHSFIISEIEIGSSVLMVGTGNSNLPRHLYDAHEGKTTIVCMDYSKPCIDMLEQMHSAECPQMSFICGDVTNLTNIVKRRDFDYIIDKGLMDAMMCGEGWDSNGAVLKYLKEAKLVLKPSGTFILVSYKLNTFTREYLECTGDALGIGWSLDIDEKSDGRVSFSIGHCLE